MNYQQFLAGGYLQEIANIVDEPENQLAILEGIGFERRIIPSNASSSEAFWRQVAREIDNGRIEGGIPVLIESISRQFPGNSLLNPDLPEENESFAQPNSLYSQMRPNSGFSLIINQFQGDVLALNDRIQQLATQMEIPDPLELTLASSNTISFFLPNANNHQVLQLREQVLQIFSDQRLEITVGAEGFRDYLIRDLFMEGPDQARYQLTNIPASTPVRELSRALISQYDDDLWPQDKEGLARPAIADRVDRHGNQQRMIPDQTLHENGVGEGDNIQVSPEIKAGAINPIIRQMALSRVRNQLSNFVQDHSEVHIKANAIRVPTQYVMSFSAKSWGTPLSANQHPPLVESHKIFINLPPDFPMKAPLVFWLTDIFHPNIDPKKNNQVCLGILDSGYKPGLDFGKLCQMIFDIASFRNYEVREWYNEIAKKWVRSDEGQAAIAEIGGQTLESFIEGAKFQDKKGSSLRIKKL